MNSQSIGTLQLLPSTLARRLCPNDENVLRHIHILL